MKRIILSTTLLLAIGLAACNHSDAPKPSTEEQAVLEEKNKDDMNSFISLFEIPATDISRAVNFYQNVLDVHIEQMEMPGMEMGIFLSLIHI